MSFSLTKFKLFPQNLHGIVFFKIHKHVFHMLHLPYTAQKKTSHIYGTTNSSKHLERSQLEQKCSFIYMYFICHTASMKKKIIAHGKAININFLIHILLYVDERGNTQHFIFSNFLDYLILFCCCFAFLFWGFVKFPVRIVIQIQIENSMQWRRLWCWHTISLPHPAFVW